MKFVLTVMSPAAGDAERLNSFYGAPLQLGVQAVSRLVRNWARLVNLEVKLHQQSQHN
jgi:hypothetical protein